MQHGTTLTLIPIPNNKYPIYRIHYNSVTPPSDPSHPLDTNPYLPMSSDISPPLTRISPYHLPLGRAEEPAAEVEPDVPMAKLKTGRSPCNEVNWFRVVLDESHKVKVRCTAHSCAVKHMRFFHWNFLHTDILNYLFPPGLSKSSFYPPH